MATEARTVHVCVQEHGNTYTRSFQLEATCGEAIIILINPLQHLYIYIYIYRLLKPRASPVV